MVVVLYPCENSTPMGLRVCNGGSAETKVSSPENRNPLTRPSVAAIFLEAAPRNASKRADSGRNNTRTGTSSRGTAPPRSNTERQPCTGIKCPAAKPMAAEPRLSPVNMIVIINERLR